MEGGNMPIEDSMTTQRLYWYRKQRLTHNGPATRGFVPHPMGNSSDPFSEESISSSSAMDYNNSVATNTNRRLSSCRFDRNERHPDRNEKYPSASIETREAKNNRPKKDLSNLPPLDISEVIETLTTLSSEGKLGKGNNVSAKEELDEESGVKVKGLLLTCCILPSSMAFQRQRWILFISLNVTLVWDNDVMRTQRSKFCNVIIGKMIRQYVGYICKTIDIFIGFSCKNAINFQLILLHSCQNIKHVFLWMF